MRASDEIRQVLTDKKARINMAKGRLAAHIDDADALRSEIERLESVEVMYRSELKVITQASTEQISAAAEGLARFANYAIPVVFGGEYERLDITPDSSGPSSKAAITIWKREGDKLHDADPYEDNGGGVNDVVSSQLKLGALTGYYPPVENAFIADEMSKHVSAKYREGLALVIRDICHNTGRQVIMVTHDPALTIASDNVIDF